MGLRINTNVLSLRAQRNVGNSTEALNRALSRLASGSRITRAGDDAAGLAVSEGLRSQVRGMRQAIRNANDSFGFLATAEGGLSEMTNILQRLRELAIQSANGTIGSRDRQFLEEEKDQLLEELDRIASQTSFNGTKLIDGSFETIDLQVGVSKGEQISFNIGDARASSLGSIATVSGAQNAITGVFGDLTLNGISIDDTTASDDGVSSNGNSFSAIAIAKVINEKSGQSNVFADIEEASVRIDNLDFSSFGGALSGEAFSINGVAIVDDSVNSVQDFVNAVNDNSNSTGVKAEIVAGGDDQDVRLYSEDGRNIQIELSSVASTAFSSSINQVFADGANFSSGSLSAQALFAAGASSTLSAGADETRTGAISLRSADAITVSGTSASLALGFTDTSIAVDLDTAINTIEIGTQDDAADALLFIDQALNQLFSLRAGLGAIENRLSSSVSSLQITSENLSAAGSQIRDADIAVETAELTKNQILQQAGVAVLGQANVSQQVALSLLQF